MSVSRSVEWGVLLGTRKVMDLVAWYHAGGNEVQAAEQIQALGLVVPPANRGRKIL